MARGDVTTVMAANLAGGASVDRQPSSGVEEMLLDVGSWDDDGSAPDIVHDVNILRIDGTNNDAVLLNGDAGKMATVWFRMKMMASNTHYFRIYNSSTTGDLTFSVIEVG